MAELLKSIKHGMFLGVDPVNKKVKDFGAAKDIVEPISVKRQVITSAAEAAQMVLRIDDVISAKDLGGGAGGPGPGGRGGDEDSDLD